jgi:hypothetical protein
MYNITQEGAALVAGGHPAEQFDNFLYQAHLLSRGITPSGAGSRDKITLFLPMAAGIR